MVSLFDVEVNDADIGFQNIQAAQYPIEAVLRSALEHLWQQYKPYADTNFRHAFARQPDSRFWEMYLTVQLVRAGKNVRPRSELPSAVRDHGPDIRIVEDACTIWIEAVTPEPGDIEENADCVPELIPINENGGLQPAPRRQVELRITSVLDGKRGMFENYREQGVVAQEDLCVVAISGARFFGQSAGIGLPRAVTAVYPLGDAFITLNRQTFEVVGRGYRSSEVIERTAATPIPRYAFLSERFAGVSGLIWSRRTIGNFLGQDHDFIFVHNFASRIPLLRGWFPWNEEYVVDVAGNEYELSRIGDHNFHF